MIRRLDYASYIHAPNFDAVHVIEDTAMRMPGERTLCGRLINDQWRFGDETRSGLAATCKTCRRLTWRGFAPLPPERNTP